MCERIKDNRNYYLMHQINDTVVLELKADFYLLFLKKDSLSSFLKLNPCGCIVPNSTCQYPSTFVPDISCFLADFAAALFLSAENQCCSDNLISRYLGDSP